MYLLVLTLLHRQNLLESEHQGRRKPHNNNIHNSQTQTHDAHGHKWIFVVVEFSIAAPRVVLVEPNLTSEEEQNPTINGRREKTRGNGNTNEGAGAFIEQAEGNSYSRKEGNGDACEEGLLCAAGCHLVGSPTIAQLSPAREKGKDATKEDANEN